MAGLNNLDNYNVEKGGYDAWRAYGQSKTTNIYMANEVEHRFGEKRLHALSLHLGTIHTQLSRHLDEATQAMFGQVPGLAEKMKGVEQGAATTVLAATAAEWKGRGGKYLEDRAEALAGEDEHNPLGTGYVPHTYDVAAAERLWKGSLKMAGLD